MNTTRAYLGKKKQSFLHEISLMLPVHKEEW
jgi:hypothetical protein